MSHSPHPGNGSFTQEELAAARGFLAGTTFQYTKGLELVGPVPATGAPCPGRITQNAEDLPDDYAVTLYREIRQAIQEGRIPRRKLQRLF